MRDLLGFDHFEFDRSGGSLGQESVTLSKRTVGFQEIRLQEDFEQVAREAFA
jgi:hypothetical protein